MGNDLRDIWKELRRRRVVSAAAAYAAMSFVVLQLAEIVFPAFDLGPGAIRVLLAGLLALFPVALAFSWVFDVTTSGLRVTAPAEEEGSERPPARHGVSPLKVGAVLVSATLLGSVGWYAVQGTVAIPTSDREASIAVLPFTDMSAEGDQAYLGDGIAEEILNILAGGEGLRVAARTSSFAFRDADHDIRDIARELGVSWVLEGSVRRSGEQVRVTAQLIDPETGFHEWSENYDRTMDDLFAVQDEIAGAIAQELLGRIETAAPGNRHVPSQAAQEAYWKGRAALSRRGATGIPAALNYFAEASRLDPEFALAYAGMADSYALLPQVATTGDPEEDLERAEELARRAIELDSTLAQPHASLGLVRAMRGDRAGALERLGRAIQLNGSYASAYHWRANVFAEVGQLSVALADASRAAQLDPLSPAIAVDHGNILLWSGDATGALAEFERALSLEFGFAPAHFGSALVHLRQGDDVELNMSLAQWAAVTGVPATLTGELASAMVAYRESGAPGDVPDQILALAEAGRLKAGSVASLYALVGHREGTIAWLRRSLDDRSWVDQYAAVNPIYEPYRGEAEFQRVLEAISRP